MKILKTLDIDSIVKARTIDIYDGSVEIAKGLRTVESGPVTLFVKDATTPSGAVGGGIAVRPCRAILQAADCVASVCILDNRAVKVLAAMYPSVPHYVLARISLRAAWLLGFPGLLRRVLLGLVRLKGITSIVDANGKRTYWFVIQQAGGAIQKISLLPKQIGIPAFLEWLHINRIEYVVMRFYERLPHLYRDAGDLDILATAEGKSAIDAFLHEHEHLLQDNIGDIRLGLVSASGQHGTVAAYSPSLARQMLANAIDGPAGSRIPAPKDALRSFIYHVLYHSSKGYICGVPSALRDRVEEYPDNDYAGVIRRMAKDAGVVLEEPITMETLDEYLAQEGWRPKLDTLAKLAETNAWVHDRFFAGARGSAVGLSVFVLREWALERGIAERVMQHMDQNEFIVVRSKIFSPEEKERAADSLRGGTWGQDADGSENWWLPAMAIVVVDRKCAGLPASYVDGFERFRIRKLKTDMREMFDTGGRGSMHATDNTHESWEYIEVCFPEEIDTIRSEVESHAHVSGISTWLRFFTPTYIQHSIKHSLKEFLVRRFLS